MGLLTGIYRALGGKPNTPDVDDDGALLVRGTLTAVIDTASLATQATLAAVLARLPALVTGRIPVDGSGVAQPISAASLPLPSGAATDRTTAAAPAAVRISADGTNFVDSTHPVRTDPTGTTTQPVSASALPLPTGAATQVTLADIDTQLVTLVNNSPTLIAGYVPTMAFDLAPNGSAWTQLLNRHLGSSAQFLLVKSGAATIRRVELQNIDAALTIYVFLLDRVTAPVSGTFTGNGIIFASAAIAPGQSIVFDYKMGFACSAGIGIYVSLAVNSISAPITDNLRVSSVMYQ